MSAGAHVPSEAPLRPANFTATDTLELLISTAAGAAGVWVIFHLFSLNAPVGFVACTLVASLTIYAIVAYERHGGLAAKDRFATVAIGIGASITLILLFLILFFVLSKGLPYLLKSFPRFITRDLKGVGPNTPVKFAGMQHAIIGTLEQVGLATIFTVPVGILAAAYLNEIGGRFAGVVRTIADAMTGLPTIIAGLFVYVTWVVPRGTAGFSGLAASFALAIIMLPTVVRTAEEVLRIVSDSLREASLALGASQWRTVLMVVLPTARAGLVTAAILGVARAVGETAPVLLTSGYSPFTNWSPIQHSQANLPIQVWTFLRSPVDNNVTEAWGGALLLVLIVLTLFSIARLIGTSGTVPRARRFRRVKRATESVASRG